MKKFDDKSDLFFNSIKTERKNCILKEKIETIKSCFFLYLYKIIAPIYND